jgi:hypothetical protein
MRHAEGASFSTYDSQMGSRSGLRLLIVSNL